MLRVLRIAALACVAAFLASAASARDVSVGLQSPVTSMDPHYHNLTPNNSLLIHIFEPLVYRDAGMKLKPALAVSWRALDDLTWEFKLRRNVRFHDGSPFTAEDVVATYKRVPNVPNSPSSYATFTKPIVETRIVDPYTIVFKTAAPHVLMPMIAQKGSIAVDGISLTVVDVFETAFTVSLIPFTLENTTAGGWSAGTNVNLEVDLVSRYVVRALDLREVRP